MRLSRVMAATAALSMVAAPVAAAPSNPAAKLSLESGSTSAALATEGSEIPTHTWLIAGLVLVAVIAAALALGGDHDGSSPASA